MEKATAKDMILWKHWKQENGLPYKNRLLTISVDHVTDSRLLSSNMDLREGYGIKQILYLMYIER